MITIRVGLLEMNASLCNVSTSDENKSVCVFEETSLLDFEHHHLHTVNVSGDCTQQQHLLSPFIVS